jgi:hypothetical protein
VVGKTYAELVLAFWQAPPLQPYLGRGWLDFALFDVENSSELTLQASGITIQT